ncbi:MAG: helix-turn-helix domain-containing protein [Bacteroidota bacterium]
MKKEHINLSESERVYLEALISKGNVSVKKYKRARGLLALDSQKTYVEASEIVGVSYPTILQWAKNYRSSGLNFLEDKSRSGRPVKLSGADRAKITALACSDPPEGYARWSLRLLADKLVELEVVESISFNQVRNILKKMNFSLTENASGASER